MNNTRFILLVLILAVSTAFTRVAPFLLFDRQKKTPAIIDYLGKVLPAAMMGLLVVYCFKDVDVKAAASLVPTAAASVSVVLLHLWKRNTILSIALGTAVYMILIRLM